MPRKPQVQRSAEEKFAIVIEGLKSGNIAETCRSHQIAATLYYRWKDEAEKAAVAALAGRNASRSSPDEEQRKAYSRTGARPGQGAHADRHTKKRSGRMSCGQVHSQARPVAGRRANRRSGWPRRCEISRSSLYYRRQAHRSRADRRYDERSWLSLRRKAGVRLSPGDSGGWSVGGLKLNRKRVLRVMRERGLLVRSRRLRVTRRKDWSTMNVSEPDQVWQMDMTKVWAGPDHGLGVSGLGARLLHPRDRRLGLESALPHPGCAGRAGPCGARGFAFRSSGKGFDFDYRQRHSVHQRPLHRHPGAAGHRASPHRLQPSRRQRTHRTLSPLTQGRGGLAQRIPELRPRTAVHRSVDRGI